MAAAAVLVAALTATIDYLRISVGGDAERTWLACADLITDPEALGAAASSSATARGAERTDIAMSLFVQGYAFRIASVTVGTWLLDGAPVAVDPTTTAIAIGRGRPDAVRLASPRVLAGGRVEDVHEHLVDGHLGPLVDAAHASCRIGRALLWGNVASSCATCFHAVGDAVPARRRELRERATAFFAAARPELRDAGTLVDVGSQTAWQRRSCCLWYQTTSAAGLCADCSLHDDVQRRARYAAMLATQSAVAT